MRDNFFVDWDDQDNFLNNSHFRGVGTDQLRWAWTTRLLGVYQPLSWMILEAEYSAFGLDAGGYHLFSLGLHAVNAAVLYVATYSILKLCIKSETARPDRWPRTCSGMAAALFAVHPLRAEVVAWASCQPYLPCALFSMLSVLAYLQAQDAGRSARSPLMARRFPGLLAAALLSKAVAVSVPLVFLILDVYPLQRLGGERGWWRDRGVWLEKVPFLALSLAFMVVAWRAKGEAA